jgi:IS30 family transposase
LKERLEQDRVNSRIHSIVVGMHKALPDSLSNAHSMSESATVLRSGRTVYRWLEAIQREDHKQVYVLSSHRHFIMTDIYNTQFWLDHEVGIVPGILVGTAGRRPLPSAFTASENEWECRVLHSDRRL